MTHREFCVLSVLGHHFEATASQVAAVLACDEQFAAYPFRLTAREAGATLGALRAGWPTRPEALVRKVDTRRWALSDAGLRALSA